MPRRRDTPEEKKRKQEQESWAATQARNDAYLRTGNIQPKDPAEPVPSVEPDDVPTPKPDPEDTFFTAEQLQTMTFPPLEWALPQIIPAEGVTLLCSKPKFGKSWLAYDLCIAATMDRFTLGTYKPAQGDVLYLALEDSKRRLQRRMQKLLPAFTGTWPDKLTITTRWRVISHPEKVMILICCDVQDITHSRLVICPLRPPSCGCGGLRRWRCSTRSLVAPGR